MIVINPRLPAGYTEITYVQAGAGAYIDLGIKGNNNTVAYIKARVINLNTQVQYTPFGVWDTTNGVQPNLSYDTVNRNCRFGGAVTQTTNISDYDVDLYFGPDKMTINGTDYLWTGEIGTFETASTMFLFMGRRTEPVGYNDGISQISVARFYSGTTLILDLVPAIRNSDSVVGMYDLVSETFFTNAGTGSFTAGKKVRFIKSIGTFPGINLWNEKYVVGRFNNSTGEIISGGNNIMSKDFIQVKPGYTLFFQFPTLENYNLRWGFWNNENEFLGTDYTTEPTEVEVPAGAVKMLFYMGQAYGTTYNHDICVNLSDPDINGTYYPYIKQIKSIAIGEDVIWQVPASDQRTVREFIPETDPDQEIPVSDEPGIYEEEIPVSNEPGIYVPDSSEDIDQLRIEEVAQDEPAEQEIPDSGEPGIYEESVPDSSEDIDQIRMEVNDNEFTE